MYNLRNPDPRQAIVDMISEELDNRNISSRKIEDAFVALVAMLMTEEGDYALKISTLLKRGKLNHVLDTLGL